MDASEECTTGLAAGTEAVGKKGSDKKGNTEKGAVVKEVVGRGWFEGCLAERLLCGM